MRVLLIPLVTLLVAGCGSGPTEVCPRTPSGGVEGGDANGDGTTDLADPVFLVRHLVDDGPSPSCEAAVDLVPDARMDVDDAVELLVYLYERLWTVPDVRKSDCPDLEPAAQPECATVDVQIDAPARSEGAFTASVTLDPGDLAVSGWSLSVSAQGCRILGASTVDTAGDQREVSAQGYRATGYELTNVDEDGATSAVLLDVLAEVSLPTAVAEPLVLLTIQVEAEGSSCGSCELTLDTPVKTYGRPVKSLLVSDAAAFVVSGTTKVTACP